jgi:hypothetical protein
MASRARAVPIHLTRKRRRKLEQIVRAATSAQRLVLRAKIVLAAAEGKTNAAIARDLGCSVAVARTWRGRFARLGIPGLFDKPRSGRPGVHGPSTRLAVIALATSVPPEGESQFVTGGGQRQRPAGGGERPGTQVVDLHNRRPGPPIIPAHAPLRHRLPDQLPARRSRLRVHRAADHHVPITDEPVSIHEAQRAPPAPAGHPI